MNKTFTLVFILIYSLSFSQNITLDELISLRKKDLATVEEKLTLKGWNYIRGEEPEIGNLGTATFAYNKSSYEDKAEAFINYLYSDVSDRKRIDIQIVKKEKYNLFLGRIKALGCKLIESNISDGNIKKIYQGATLTFIISISTQKDDFSSTLTFYHFFIMDNSDYRNNFDENVIEVDSDNNTVVDSTAAYVPEVTENIEEVEGNKPEINEEFFIGKWSNENSVFTFSSLGKFTQIFDDGNEIVTKWKFVNNKLFVGENNNLTKYNIIDNNSNYISYNTNKNQKIFYAYRIGN
jgi:hypothetical protein